MSKLGGCITLVSTGLPEADGYTFGVLPTGDQKYVVFKNVTAVGATTSDPAEYVLKHEMGHVFQLQHRPYSPGNLMCSGDTWFEVWLPPFNLQCSAYTNRHLEDWQIIDARKNAARLMEWVSQ